MDMVVAHASSHVLALHCGISIVIDLFVAEQVTLIRMAIIMLTPTR